MSSFKEIVTKAVIGKAKKTNSNSFTLTPEEIPNTVLGCWVINHSFNGVKGTNGSVTINGNFDVNVWYSYDADKKTAVTTKKFSYTDNLNVPLRNDANMDGASEIIVRCLKQPTVANVKIEDGNVLQKKKKCVDQHIELAVNIFKKIWSDDTLDINIRLFIAYIVEERMRAFGDRWMAEGEIENIRQWESKNTLDSTLSNNYGSCLEFFVQNELVYASSWTSYGNPREYTLFPSLQELLFNCPHKIMEELQKVKDAYHLDLPF